MYEVTSQSEAKWRTHRRPTSQQEEYLRKEIEVGFGIEALMAGSNKDRDESGEASGDAEALSGGDLRCGIAMVWAPSYIGKCLWINPSGFHIQAYCGCDTMLVGEALCLPSELAGDRGSSGMSTSNRGR